MRNILIIGGTGFVGKSIQEYVIENTDDRITLLGRNFRDIDFRNFDLVIHAGASADPRYNKETFIESFEASNETTKLVHRKLLNENPGAKYLYISSGCVNFSTSELINNSYLELKRTGELYAYDLFQKGIQSKIIRLFSVIGKQIDYKSSLAVNTFIRKAKNSESITLHPNADNILRSYLYADEMSQQILSSFDTEDYCLEIGSSDIISIKEVAELVAKFFSVETETANISFYSNTVEKQLPKNQFKKEVLSSKEAILKTLNYVK
jgi:nucleoside-diphosphate-sugar epimerase